MDTKIIEVTPKMARDWLGKNTLNRNVNKSNVDKFSRDMISGNWGMTHQGIAIFKSGRFADGQHRLLAVIKSGCTVPMVVTFDVDDSQSIFIDSSKPRTSVDQARISGNTWVNAKHASSIRMMANCAGRRSTFSTTELMDRVNKMQPSLDFSFNAIRTKKQFITAAPIYCAVSLAHFSGVDENRLQEFCDVLVSGVVSSRSDIAAIRLRDYLTSTRDPNRGRTMCNSTQIKTQRAIKGFLSSEEISRLVNPSELIYNVPDFI